MKDAFCEAEMTWVAMKLQASFNAKLPSLYAQQYEYGYWDGYTEVERLVGGDYESPTEDVVELTHDGKRDHSSQDAHRRCGLDKNPWERDV